MFRGCLCTYTFLWAVLLRNGIAGQITHSKRLPGDACTAGLQIIF